MNGYNDKLSLPFKKSTQKEAPHENFLKEVAYDG
jgi:hypothetical protein